MNGNTRPTTWHWRLLGRLGTDVRVEETRATLLFAYSFLIGAFQFAAKSIRQSSFVDSLGWTQLPSSTSRWRSWPGRCCAPGIGWREECPRALHPPIDRRRDRQHGPVLVALRLCLAVAAFSLLRLDLDRHPAGVQSVLELGQLLDPRQARRLFAFVLSGALVGGVAGGQVATMVTRWIDARATPAAAAILLATPR